MPAPQIPTDLTDTIRKLEQQVRELQGRVSIRPAQADVTSGAVTVGAGGQFKVVGGPTGTTVMFWVGGISPANPDGTPQRGLIAARQDGSYAITLFNLTNNPGDPQGLVLRDARGNTLLAEDVIAGGLAAPAIGADGWYGFTETPAWTTTSATFAVCMSLPWPKYSPRVQAYYLARCSDGTTSGEIRLRDGAGAVVGTITLAAGSYVVSSVTGPVTGAHGAVQTLTWEARVTGGTGTVGVRGLTTIGVGS